MKAVQLIRFEGLGSVEIAEIETPVVAEKKVLVVVHAAGVNPFDWKLTTGMMPVDFPFVLGGDFAGVVRETGPGVDGLREGDEVYGTASRFSRGSGSFAELALAAATVIARKPAELGMLEAGAIPLTGVSALQALTEHMELRSGQKILVHGGAGGIGTAAIQIARHLGARVATTVRAAQSEYVRAIGADEIIDRESQQFEALLHDYDAVFDTVGGETCRRSFRVLKRGGVLVSMVEKFEGEHAGERDVRAIGQATKVTRKRLEELAGLIDQGVVAVHIDRVFPLERAAEALAHLHEGHPRGKVVLEVGGRQAPRS